MKTPEEMAAYFKAMPSKKKENPYWQFDDTDYPMISSRERMISPCMQVKPLNLKDSVLTLKTVREFFRRFYESFHSEAQVLCVTPEDGKKLMDIGIPVLTQGQIGPFDVTVVVLPQDNHMGTSVISESFWQERIVNAGIIPVARIHSHHILDPYQSVTDYSTLNSGTLEMVIGKINNEHLRLCYWLDVPGTNAKEQVFLAREDDDGTGNFDVCPHIFNGPRAVHVMDRNRMKIEFNTGAGVPDVLKNMS